MQSALCGYIRMLEDLALASFQYCDKLSVTERTTKRGNGLASTSRLQSIIEEVRAGTWTQES